MAASYPGSVKSFTTKVDLVDTIAAAHVNDLQDEIVAIETLLGADPRRYVQFSVVPDGLSCAVADGQYYWHVPARMAGLDLVEVHAEAITAGATGTMAIQIRNVTSGNNMLSTAITLDNGETGSDTAAAPAVIDTAEDDLTVNDLIAVDIDTIQTTAAKGLIVTLGFS